MGKIAVIIPAHNEELVIAETIRVLEKLIDPSDIYVRSDGSTDATEEIVKKFKVNFSKNKKNIGKTLTIKSALQKYSILDRYEYLMILDADTRPYKDFFINAVNRFKDQGIACVCGQVESEPKFNYFIAYRSLMYAIWQNIYKVILSKFNAITIAPGPSSLHRTSVFKKIDIDEQAIIEDFDITFQIHRKKLGKIVYESTCKVVTQDPDNLSSYFRQITRWQLGFIQSSIHHKVPLKLQAFDIAIIIFLFQELTHAVYLIIIFPLTIWITFFALYPSIAGYYIYKNILFGMLAFELWFVWGLAIYYSIRKRSLSTVIFGPFLWLIQYVNIVALLKALYLALFRSVKGAWHSPDRR